MKHLLIVLSFFIFTNTSGGWSYPRAWNDEGANLPKFQLYNLILKGSISSRLDFFIFQTK